MFAVFGEIVFEVLSSPDGFGSSRSWHYAEHRVVQARPKLQWIADDLEILDLDFHFHASFTDPSMQLDALIAAADDHVARPLVFGNGVHRGYFILMSIRTSYRQMSDDGNLIAISLRAVLKEWAALSELNSISAPVASFPLIGVITAPPGVATGSIAYTDAPGQGDLSSPPVSEYVPTLTASPGVSPLLNLPGSPGLPTPLLTVSDVAPSTIVRASR